MTLIIFSFSSNFAILLKFLGLFDLPAGNTCDNGMGGNVMQDDGTGANYAPLPNPDTRDYGRSGS